MASADSTASELKRMYCRRRVTKLVTYVRPVRHIDRVRTRKCVLLVFCKTAYRIRERYSLKTEMKEVQEWQRFCCNGYHKHNGTCVANEILTSTPTEQSTISDEINRANLENETSAWMFSNTTDLPIVGQNKEPQITGSNQTSLIVGFIAWTLSVFIIVVIVVVYKRRKKAANYKSEIPYSEDVMPLPSKSKKDSCARQEGINYRNFPPMDENAYMSMDSGCNLKVPSVKMMLATRGSGYRFSGLDEDTQRRADSLYMVPDSAAYHNQKSQLGVGADIGDRKCLNKSNPGKAADIYINGQSVVDKVAGEDEENIYSEIRAKNFKQTDLVGDENGYSFIRMDCVKESEPEETDREAETSLYSSLHEGYSNGGSNMHKGDVETMHGSRSVKVGKTEGSNDSSTIRSKNRRHGNTDGEREAHDDTCDSGIYTSINPDSDKDDEPCSDPTYDEPKNMKQVNETKIQNGSDFYENCRRDSDKSNYDIPRPQVEDEDVIYSDISSTTSPTTNIPVITHTS